jgi:hypothetical protein
MIDDAPNRLTALVANSCSLLSGLSQGLYWYGSGLLLQPAKQRLSATDEMRRRATQAELWIVSSLDDSISFMRLIFRK